MLDEVGWAAADDDDTLLLALAFFDRTIIIILLQFFLSLDILYEALTALLLSAIKSARYVWSKGMT